MKICFSHKIYIGPGLDPGRETGISGMLLPPAGFKIINGVNPGELTLSVKRSHQAVSYIYQITEEPLSDNKGWISRASACSEYTFTGLTRGRRIYGCCIAIDTSARVAYTGMLSRLVQ